MPNVNLTMPTDYSVELEGIRRRRKLAQLMQEQSLQPVDFPQASGGWAVPMSWTQGLAQMAKGAVGGMAEKRETEREKALAKMMLENTAAELSQFEKTRSGTPAIPGVESVAFEGGRGPETPAVPGNLSAAYAGLLRSQDPALRQLALTQLPKQDPSADALLRYKGEMERHRIPSAGAILQNQGAMQRHEMPSGSAQLGANVSMRGQDIGAATAARGQGITVRGQDLGVNPDIQAAVANARAYGKEAGETRAGIEFDPVKASVSAKKILAAINYNPETKTDDISKLIQQSTSGLLQNYAAQGYGAVTGQATTGRQAIGELMTYANRLTMDLMGGKLGSGISNADRDFVLGQLGDVANANTPAPERAAAWNRAMTRLISVAGSPPQQRTPAAEGLPSLEAIDAELRRRGGG